MKYIKGFFAFWYDFIVGDAWEVAAGVVITLLLLYLAVHYTASASNPSSTSLASNYGALVFPVVIVALLAYSLWRVRKT